MENADPVERKWACVAVSNLIHNDPSTRRLLQGKNVVGTLIGRLTDSEEEVVVEAAGALRCVLSVFLFQVSIFKKINKWQLIITNFHRGLSEIYASTADMKFVPRCTIKISLRHWQHSYLK